MKLLFDQNLSPKLAPRLADVFPGSQHVQAVGLDCASDEQVWEFARVNGFAIVSKDADFHNLSVLRGAPPRSCGCWWGIARPPVSSPSCAHMPLKSTHLSAIRQSVRWR